jgi:phosphoadenosine phosphosulfate reductase
LVGLLGLSNVRDVRPRPGDLAEADSSGRLWSSDPDRCCFVRKVAPLNRALMGFDAWATGRTQDRGGVGTQLDTIEMVDGRVKINPIAGWAQGDIEDYLALRNLPLHPLVADGFLSIGCVPCTDAVLEGEDARAGRWRGSAKTECGIHLGREALPGRVPQTNP